MLRRLAVLAFATGCATTASRAPTLVGTRLPDVQVEALDGKRSALSAVIAGRPALINLWATWCESCAAEFAPLARLAPKAATIGAYTVAVSIGEPRATVVAFSRARGLTHPLLVDEASALSEAIGARSIPATIVVDRDGTIVYRGAALDRAAIDALERATASH